MGYLESTRDKNIKSRSSEGILKGIADDGGLFVKRDIENVKIDLTQLHNKSYKEMAKLILTHLLEDYSPEEIGECVEKAYTDKFSTDEITPVVKVGDGYILELFHGPTSAFKDVALSILPHLTTTALKKNSKKEKLLILTATSGDTGKAALEGFKNIENIKIAVFFPEDGVSEIQKKQMVSQEGDNTYVFGIKGNFDDAQRGVKEIFTNPEIKAFLKERGYSLSSANSINIGRLVPQIVYYFYGYMSLIKRGELSLGERVNFVVPTGNFGDILAGFYAEIMGLPINKLICASNENNVLYDFLKTGVYDKNRPFHKTISPSMDILISSNLERALYHLSGNDNSYVASLMEQLKERGKYKVSDEVKKNLEKFFFGGYTNDEQSKVYIKKVYEKYSYLIDTHTAVAYNVMEEYRKKTGDTHKNIILSSASPYKFSRSVYEAIFGSSDIDDEFKLMELLEEKTGVPIPENLKNLKNRRDIHNKVIEKDQMEKVFEVIL